MPLPNKQANEIEIKLLKDCSEHISELANLWYEGISKQWVPNSSVERAKLQLQEHLNHNKMPVTLVAFFRGKPMGMASLRENDGIRPDLAPWLGSLVVHPEHQRQKIGEKLIDATKNQAKIFGHGALYLLAFDLTIPSWYARLGWQTIGHDQLFNHPVEVMMIPI